MRRSLASLLICLLCMQPAWLHAGGGKLQQVREEVRPEKQPDSKKQEAADKEDDEDAWSFGDDDEPADDDSIAGEVFFYALFGSAVLAGMALYAAPAAVVGDDGCLDFSFQRYPYADDSVGAIWRKQYPPRASCHRSRWTRKPPTGAPA
jgi:hypothetical protein